MLSYEVARPKIRTGDLIAVEGNAFFSRLIQRFDRTSVSHCGIALKVQLTDGREPLFILESMEPSGVQVRALSHIGDFKWLPVKSTTQQRQAIQRDAMAHLGRVPYSKRGIAVQILRPLIGDAPSAWLSSEETICSRYAAWLLADNLGRPDVPAAPTPAELELWCEVHLQDTARGQGSIRISNTRPEPVKLDRKYSHQHLRGTK